MDFKPLFLHAANPKSSYDGLNKWLWAIGVWTETSGKVQYLLIWFNIRIEFFIIKLFPIDFDGDTFEKSRTGRQDLVRDIVSISCQSGSAIEEISLRTPFCQ